MIYLGVNFSFLPEVICYKVCQIKHIQTLAVNISNLFKAPSFGVMQFLRHILLRSCIAICKSQDDLLIRQVLMNMSVVFYVELHNIIEKQWVYINFLKVEKRKNFVNSLLYSFHLGCLKFLFVNLLYFLSFVFFISFIFFIFTRQCVLQSSDFTQNNKYTVHPINIC